VVETNVGFLPGGNGRSPFVATGFRGNGMTFGTLGAHDGGDECWQAKSMAELFRPAAKEVLMAPTWHYSRENKDYPTFSSAWL
jgi:hypothetical protein